MTFAQKLRLLCEEQRLSQRELVQRVEDVSKYMVNRWFLGAEPSLSQAAKLSRVLGVPLDYLADEHAEYPPKMNGRRSPSLQSPDDLSETPDIRMIVSAIGREEALDRLLLRRREAVTS